MAGGAARILVWRGSKQLQHQPDSPEFTETAEGPAFVYHYQGPYAVVMTAKPKRLSTFKGLPAGFVVDKMTVKRAPGGLGVLTFTALPIAAAGFSGGGGGEKDEPVYEIEWTDRVYGAHQQSGSKAGSKHNLPPRPFFPFCLPHV
jgi:hypothetical protein